MEPTRPALSCQWSQGEVTAHCRLLQAYRLSSVSTREHFCFRKTEWWNSWTRFGRPVDPKDVDIILSGLTSDYNTQLRILGSSSDWPTREWIEPAVVNMYERLESENRIELRRWLWHVVLVATRIILLQRPPSAFKRGTRQRASRTTDLSNAPPTRKENAVMETPTAAGEAVAAIAVAMVMVGVGAATARPGGTIQHPTMAKRK